MAIKILQKADGTVPKYKKITPTFKHDGGNLSAVKPKREKVLSIRAQKAITVVANGGKSKAAALRGAGFSEAVARNPSKVFDQEQVGKVLAPIVDRMIAHRDRVLARMDKLVGKAGYTALSITASHMTKDIELLSGRPTAREEYVLDEEEKAVLDRLLAKNGKK